MLITNVNRDMSNTATLKDAKIVDPNILKIAFYDLEKKEYINVGRGIKKFNADVEFSFFTIDNPDGSKTEIANFSLASLSVQTENTKTNAIPIQQQLTSTNTLSALEQDQRISIANK